MTDWVVDQSNAIDTHEIIIKIKEEIHKNFFELAISLKMMRDNKYYTYLEYNSFEEYLDQPEVDISKSYASKLIINYERWVERYGHKIEELKGIDPEKLYIAGSQINDTNQDEWLEKARLLSRADLRASTPGSIYKPTLITCPFCKKTFPFTRNK